MKYVTDDKGFALQLSVTLLDDTVHCFSLSPSTKSISILSSLLSMKKLTQLAYFGLRVVDRHNRVHWLDPEQRVQMQMKELNCTPVIEQSVNHFAKDNQPLGSRSDASKIGAPIEPKNVLTTHGQYSLLSCGPLCGANSRISPDSPRLKSAFQDTLKPLTLTYHAYFGVRYYPLDPTQIMDEQTRYQIFLQVRDDLVSGRMPVNEDMFVKLCGLSLQSDCGDYGEDKLGVDYVRRLLKMPHLSRALEARIKEKHAECKGRQPALVEYQFLECAKQCMSYGQVKFAVLDTVSNLGCLFGIGPAGVTIEETQSSLIHFSWMQISGFSGKSKHLSIHITDQGGKFTYHYAVDDKKRCRQIIKQCKQFLHFYRSELPKSLYWQSLNMVNTNSPGQSRSAQMTGYSNTTVSQPPPVYEQGSHVLGTSPADQETCPDGQSDVHHGFYPHPPSVFEGAFGTYVPHVVRTSIMPPNPYHVPAASTHYQPRGCLTDLVDDGQSTAYLSTRTAPVAFPPRRGSSLRRPTGLYRDAMYRHSLTSPTRVRHNRSVFPKTKHYVIDEPVQREPSTVKFTSHAEQAPILRRPGSARVRDQPGRTQTLEPTTYLVNNAMEASGSHHINWLPTHSHPTPYVFGLDTAIHPGYGFIHPQWMWTYGPPLINRAYSVVPTPYPTPVHGLPPPDVPPHRTTSYRRKQRNFCHGEQAYDLPERPVQGDFQRIQRGNFLGFARPVSSISDVSVPDSIPRPPARLAHRDSEAHTSDNSADSALSQDLLSSSTVHRSGTDHLTKKSSVPSLLRSSNQNSDSFDDVEDEQNIEQALPFCMPPTPDHGSPKKPHTDSGGLVVTPSKTYPENNLPTPPAQSLLNKLNGLSVPSSTCHTTVNHRTVVSNGRFLSDVSQRSRHLPQTPQSHTSTNGTSSLHFDEKVDKSNTWTTVSNAAEESDFDLEVEQKRASSLSVENSQSSRVFKQTNEV
ncbi:Band 4.1-like protein 3 [Clonorchis sinensis]|uniref:Band 4.1-like protein 3 n=1 Tax=Clonorchis sinensis TaxID=79923 RepID=A0A8T1LXK3_CLOSI|nr:Band 4.1-like protein 3 [Clonorchis sinensis]